MSERDREVVKGGVRRIGNRGETGRKKGWRGKRKSEEIEEKKFKFAEQPLVLRKSYAYLWNLRVYVPSLTSVIMTRTLEDSMLLRHYSSDDILSC